MHIMTKLLIESPKFFSQFFKPFNHCLHINIWIVVNTGSIILWVNASPGLFPPYPPICTRICFVGSTRVCTNSTASRDTLCIGMNIGWNSITNLSTKQLIKRHIRQFPFNIPKCHVDSDKALFNTGPFRQ